MILYIHIPFCVSKCGYCAFNSSADFFHLQEDYVNALLLDLDSQIGGKKLSSIYFGGGTPNTLHQHYYEKIFNLINQRAVLQDDCEITIECNPNLIQKDWCKYLASLGVNRVSLGVQSFFDDKLSFLQRDHHCYDIFKSVDVIRASAISNISIDLIYNTPFDSLNLLEEEIKNVEKLEISHLSAYALSIDKGSKFYKTQPKLSYDDFSFEIRELLKESGFIQYEVSSYFRREKSKHNLAYWRGEDYLGCGAGGVGCIDGIRSEGNKHIPSYIQNPLKKQKEFLSLEQRKFEKLFLGLRCEIGIPLDEVDAKKADILLKEQKCHLKQNSLIANDFFLADEIVLWLSS